MKEMNMNGTFSSIKWTRENNLKQYAQGKGTQLYIRFFPSHENQYCLYITRNDIPTFKFMPHFQFATEAEAREFGLAVVNHFIQHPELIAELNVYQRITPLVS